MKLLRSGWRSTYQSTALVETDAPSDWPRFWRQQLRCASYLVAVDETRPTVQRGPSARQLTLTAAGMVAVVNSVVVAACTGLALEAAGVNGLAIPSGRAPRAAR